MTQPHHEYRQSFIVGVPLAGMVMQLYGPAPDDPWDEKALWGDMAGWGLPATTKLRIEYTRPVLADGTLGQYPDGPRDVVAVIQTEDREGVVVNAKLPLLPADGAVAVDKIRELSRQDGQPLGRRALMRMGLGAVHKALGKVLESPIAQAHLGERWTLEKPNPGRPGRDDLFYAQWAHRYVEALEVEPTKPVKHLEVTSDDPGVTGDEIRARLRRARERGLLTAAPTGRPGGELTDKAKRLLREAGLNGEAVR
jgi:hypothetical protein